MKRFKIVLCAVLCLALFLFSGCDFNFDGKALADGKVGEEYNDSIANGKNDMYYDLDYDSSLPLGLILLDDGSIIGTPEEAGEFSFKAVAIDANDNEKYADFTINIAKGELSYTGGALVEATTGEPYQQSIATATGMPGIIYSVKEGNELPEGLALSDSGEISGIPAKAAEEVSFIIVASASGCDSVEAVFTMKIAQGEEVEETLGHIVFEDFTLPDAFVGETYSQSIRRAYGVPDISYRIRFSAGAGLPSGMKSDASLGIISGTPTNSTAGEITFTVTASAEGYESVSVKVKLTVYDQYVATDKFETEYIYMDKLSGNGYSSAPSGTNMLQSFDNASNGWALGYLNKPIEFSFEIIAAADTTAKLTLYLGTEVGSYTYDSSMFEIIVNGKSVDYGRIDVKEDGSGNDMKFNAYEISPLIELAEGNNVITFKLKESDKATGTFSAVGCIVDCIGLTETSCELGWRPKVGNLNGK